MDKSVFTRLIGSRLLGIEHWIALIFSSADGPETSSQLHLPCLLNYLLVSLQLQFGLSSVS